MMKGCRCKHINERDASHKARLQHSELHVCWPAAPNRTGTETAGAAEAHIMLVKHMQTGADL